MEVLNIAKIKDGLYIDDIAAGTNMRLLIQLKISHIINTCENQIPYNFENAGIKYLTYNWPENPSNDIYFIKEELQRKIMFFIDNSLQNGTGIMIFSIKGQNRACVAIIIYLMKKYNWSLKKCREYLSTKKQSVHITKNFINQLMKFEEKLIKKNNNNMLINDWFNINLKDQDELLMNNTYLNEKEITKKKYLIQKKFWNKENDKSKENIKINKEKPHIQWADNINSEKFGINSLISKYETIKDLYYKKEVIPITSHIKMKPTKTCIKNNFCLKGTNEKKIFLLGTNKSVDNKTLNKKREKNAQISIKTKILKNTFSVDDKPKMSRKITYDSYDNKNNNNENIKKNYLETYDNKNVIDSSKKTKINNFFENDMNYIIDINNKNKKEDENEKNNNIKILNNSYPKNIEIKTKDEYKIRKAISKDKNKSNNYNILLNSNDDNSQLINNNYLTISQKQINNFINNNISKQINRQKKRGLSSKRDKNNKNMKLYQNKKYYLGEPDSKKTKENEKDTNVIPNINQNNNCRANNYEYNHNFHNNKGFIRSLINNNEIKNNLNKSIRNNNRHKEKGDINNSEVKNKLLYYFDNNSINKPKNAFIFNKYSSYDFKPSEPVKLNNNIYKLTQSGEKKNNFMIMNDKVFNNKNTYETIPKGMKNYKKNRPLSAKRDNLNYKKNNSFNNFNGFYIGNMTEFIGPKKRIPSPMNSHLSLMKNNSNYINKHNNRYAFSNSINNIGIEKK